MSHEDIEDLDPMRRHAQEPAEGDTEPGEATSSLPHPEEPAEGDDDPGTVTPGPAQ